MVSLLPKSSSWSTSKFNAGSKCANFAHISRSQVNNKVLDFEDLVNGVVNGTFNVTLPAMFKMQQGTTSAATEIKENESGGGKENSGGKNGGQIKRKSKDGNGNGNTVKNTLQPDEFKLLPGKTWKENFVSILPHNRPNWGAKEKMCAQFHIMGDCFDNCSMKSSHGDE